MSEWNKERVQALVNAYGLSHQEIAKRLGVKVGTLRNWLYGRPITGPSAALLEVLEQRAKRAGKL